MVTFAELSGFNPLVPENWYSVSSQDIIDKVLLNLIFLCCFSY